MNNPFLRFTSKTAVVFIMVFFIHLLVLKLINSPAFKNSIILSYSINLILVIAVFGFLYLFRNKFKSQLGFLFLGGSVLKFAVFFAVFYPIFKEDTVITKLEFASFFIPYSLGLVLETTSLSKWLNSLD